MTTCGCCGLNFCCAPVRDAVCVPITKNIGYLTSLSDNVRSLEMEMADLIASHRDVVAAIEREERDGPQRRTERVDVWMTDVGRVTTDLQDFHTKYKEGRSGSKYKLSKRADRLLKQVRELRSNKSEFNGQYTRELPIPSKNVWLLRKKMPELIKSQEDVLRRAERLEGTGSQKRTDEVVRWLDRVMSLQAEYNILQGDIERVCNCEGSCSLNCGPSDELGNRANDMVEEARRLETRRAGFNENLTEKFVPPSEYVRLLRKEWDELYASRDDVLRRLNLEEMRGRKRTNKVTLWLNRVQSLEADLSGFSLSPSPSNQHGKRASELLEDVTELKRTIPGFSDDNEMTEELMSPNRDVWLLRKEMRELIASRDGLLRKVIKLEEMHGQERTNQVVSWLETVRSLEEEYDNLEVDLSNICTCHGSCYLNCSPSNELGKRSAVLLDEVRVTNTKRSELTKLVEAIPGPISLETDSPLKEALEQLHRFCFKTDEASVIGVCGMGGIGKTTLMERFEAELLHRPGDFKKIIFVVVSKEPNAQKMQKEIGMVLGLHIQDGENIERHANQILKILQDMRYALLMDDVWNGSILKKILKDIGIPLPNMINKSKLIVTTRTEKVCNQMGTGDYKVRISCLKSEEAWALFKKSVGELIINSDPDIHVHAKAMAKK